MPREQSQLIAPGEGERIREGCHIKAARDELVAWEISYEPERPGPPLHLHRHHADAFYVLEGRLEITLDEGAEILDKGDFVLIPPEVIHTFGNPGPRAARYLNVHAPGMGFEERLRGGKPDFDQEDDPPPSSGRPSSEAIIHRAGEGKRLALGESTATIKAGSDDALGSFALIELEVAAGFPGPLLHRHEHMTDSFYVLEGELPVQIGEERLSAPPGSYAYVPPGNAHTFAGSEQQPVRVLNLMAPAGLECYLEEVAELGGPPDPAQMAEFASRYDFESVSSSP